MHQLQGIPENTKAADDAGTGEKGTRMADMFDLCLLFDRNTVVSPAIGTLCGKQFVSFFLRQVSFGSFCVMVYSQ